MRLHLNFDELEHVIMSKSGKQVSISRLSNDTIVLRVMFLVPVEISLTVLSVDNNLIVLQYNGGLAVKSVIGGFIKLFQTKLPMLSFDDDRKILIHLNKIENIKKVTDLIEFKDITFDDFSVIFEGNLS